MLNLRRESAIFGAPFCPATFPDTVVVGFGRTHKRDTRPQFISDYNREGAHLTRERLH